jgi:D-amino-acid dehydrogenase
MRVVVVGAGVIGVTTAYYLAEAGFDVTVVDRAAEVADGASYANAGQLSYSFTDALAKPEFIAKLPALLAGRDIGSRVHPASALLPWGMRFLAQCTGSRARRNTVAVLQTALRSARLLNELRDAVPFDFSFRSAGKLVLLASDHELQSARANAALKNQNGSDTEILSARHALEIEPAIGKMAVPIVGAVYSKSDQVADCRLFTLRLKERLEQSGKVTFRLGTSVDQIVTSEGRVRSLRLADGEIDAEAVVVCTGAWSPALLQPLGINPVVYPVRGYSVTLPALNESPAVSITVLARRIVFSRINGAIRIAGFADFNGFSTRDDKQRVDAMVDVARRCAPLAADYTAQDQHAWGGFRPMTPDGRPRVGPTIVKGLYLNTGHGTLGWTLACASGHDLARTIASPDSKRQ